MRLANYIFLKRAREKFQTKFHQESTIQSTTTSFEFPAHEVVPPSKIQKGGNIQIMFPIL